MFDTDFEYLLLDDDAVKDLIKFLEEISFSIECYYCSGFCNQDCFF